MNKFLCLFCVAVPTLLLVAPMTAIAQFVVETRGSVEVTNYAIVNGKTNINITVSGAASGPGIILRPTAVTSALGSLFITINTPDLIELVIGDAADAIRCASVDSVDFVRTPDKIGTVILTNLRTGINQIPGGGLTSGNVGSVRVHGWNAASIAGSVTGNIVMAPRTESNMDTEGTITQLSNTTIAGSLLGNINCDRGSILNLVVIGTIGTRANPVTISADGTRATITNISCAAFYGTLRGRSELASAPAPREFRTTSGPIVGTLRVAGLGNPTLTSTNDGLSCAGDLEAQVNINGVAYRPITVTGTILADKYIRIITMGATGNANPNISINRLASGATLRLENALPSSSTITFGSAGVPGLAGQVLINASNGGGTWAGTVRVGGSSGTVLSPLPNPIDSAQQYTSTAIGGGAVGRAPFTVWKRDCSPPTVGSQPGAQSLGAFGQGSVPVDVKFNGPVQLGTGIAQPLFLEYQVPRSTAWNSINAGSMSQSFPGGSSGRTVRLQGVPGIPVNGVGLYRATPTSNLLSNISPTAPVAVTTDAFTFYLGCTIGGNPNPADLVGGGSDTPPDGIVDGNDFIAFINAFNAGEPLADIVDGGGNPPGDGIVDGSDFVAFINAFGVGC